MSKHIIIGQSTNINVFSWLLVFFKLREREREWYTKFGYKGQIAQNYLIFRRGSTGESFFFHGLIDFIHFFFTLAWRTWGPSCLRYSFVFNPEYWLWFVCPLRTLLKNCFLTIYFRWRGEPHFRFGVPANHLASLSLPFRCPATWGY